MSFDAGKFERAKLVPRTEAVEVDALAAFFDEGEKALWVVRNLTSSEMHRAMEASKRQQNIETIVEAIAKGGDQVQAVRQAIGLTSDTPGEIVKRLEMLVMASVTPKIELPTAVKLAENFAIEFLSLTNKISELTGRGAELGKPAAASQPTTS